MKTQHISLILLFVLLCPAASAQWVRASSPEGGPITCFVIGGEYLFVGTTGGGVFRSSDMGTTWTPMDAGLTNTSVWSLAVADTNLFAGTYGGGVFLSTDGGASWRSASDGLEESHVLALALDGPNMFAGTLGGVFLSTDNGMTWTGVNNGLTNVYVRTLAVNRGRIFAGTYGGGVFVSKNNGTTWAAASDGLTNTDILNFAFLGSYIFAGTYGGVFRSNEDADFWEPVNLDSISSGSVPSDTNVFGSATGSWSRGNIPLEGKAVYSLAVIGSDLYVGTYGLGVLRSTNAGRNWTAVNAGLGTLDLSVLSVCGTNFYAGTLGGEVWRRPVSELVSGVERLSNELPAHFVLEQNYPNPFNPSTSIHYQLPMDSHVSLVVYDILGQEVAVLVNERKRAGRYEVNFEATGLSSGVYLYRLNAGTYSETKKLVFLK
jgi:photosystem II stability/assembly factor-like uncharacterized protein